MKASRRAFPWAGAAAVGAAWLAVACAPLAAGPAGTAPKASRPRSATPAPKLVPEQKPGSWPWAGGGQPGGPPGDQPVGGPGPSPGTTPPGPDLVQPGASPLPAGPAPGASPGAPGPLVQPSPLPSAAAPPSLAPSTAPSAPPSLQPTPSPSAAPGPSLAAPQASLLFERLQLVSQLGFLQGNAGMISNNGGSLLSNNGSGILSNNAGAYRLAQAPTPEVALELSPRTGIPLPENLQVRRAWHAGGGKLRFRPPADPTGDDFRDVDLHPNGNWAWREAQEEVTARHPSGSIRLLHVVKTTMGEDGRLRLRRDDEQEKQDGTKTALRYRLTQPPMKVRVPETGVQEDIEAYELDAVAGTGSFRVRFLGTNHTEEGSLSQVTTGAGGSLTVAYGDPLGVYAGTATVRDAQGQLLYTKARRLEGSKVFRRYDLGEGLVLDLERGAGNLFSGPVTHQGGVVGSATLGIYADGTHKFNVTLNGGSPRLVGYGFATPDLPLAPRARAAWVASTVAGGARGDQQGPGASARFMDLRGLVAAPDVANRWYAADAGAHRIVQIDLGASFTVRPYAGTGQAGDANGLAASASFRAPWGLAFGPDGSLYVAEQGGHRIRRIRPNGGNLEVDTVAGDANATGTADGLGLSARFHQPTALAVIGQRLYVGDTLNHRIRAIALDQPGFPVSTAAGNGQAGIVDGTLSTASLFQPLAMVAEGNRLIVATSRTLRRVDLDAGTVSTLAGNGLSAANFYDGAAGEAGLFPPTALAANGQGGYVTGGLDLRWVQPDGSIRTLSGQSFFGDRDGEHDEASFNRIYGLALVDSQRLLVTEARDPGQPSSLSNSRLRLLSFRAQP